MTPEDTIMELVDNVESLYNAKLTLFDRWMEAGDTWSERRARRQAKYLGRQFARDLRDMDMIRGRYKNSDFEEFATEVIQEFYEHREEAIKAAVERPRDPVTRKPMTPGEVEHAEKCEALARQIGIEDLQALIPAPPERIRRALETGDSHLNTIPLRKWDAAAEAITTRGLSLSDKVCSLKHVAKWHYA